MRTSITTGALYEAIQPNCIAKCFTTVFADIGLRRILGILAMSFDVIFICQHYVLYRKRDVEGGGERRPLLESSE